MNTTTRTAPALPDSLLRAFRLVDRLAAEGKRPHPRGMTRDSRFATPVGGVHHDPRLF